MSFFKKQWKRLLTIALFLVLAVMSLEIGVMPGVGVRSIFVGGELSALEQEIARLTYLMEGETDRFAWFALYQEQEAAQARYNLLNSRRSVLIHSRIPRTLAIILSAAGLSVAGLLMQAISRNKFMSPTTAGTIDAAALGMLIGVVFFGTWPLFTQAILAFIFALAATMIFTSVIGRLKLREVAYIPLIGLLYGGLINAIATAIGFRNALTPILIAFNTASFAGFGDFTMLYIVLPPLFVAVLFATRFSIIGLGEDFAKNLGVNYKRVVFLGLVIIALISASTFVAIGPLPFVGLIIPNMATSFYGDNLKKSIFDLMIFGAAFVLLCDIVSRLVIFPFEMPVSVTVSVIGGIIFLIYLVRGMRRGKVK